MKTTLKTLTAAALMLVAGAAQAQDLSTNDPEFRAYSDLQDCFDQQQHSDLTVRCRRTVDAFLAQCQQNATYIDCVRTVNDAARHRLAEAEAAAEQAEAARRAAAAKKAQFDAEHPEQAETARQAKLAKFYAEHPEARALQANACAQIAGEAQIEIHQLLNSNNPLSDSYNPNLTLTAVEKLLHDSADRAEAGYRMAGCPNYAGPAIPPQIRPQLPGF
jgi:hypothetical protein